MASTTKLVPPAKSVTLSNLQEQATRKNENCMATVTIAQIARLFVSSENTRMVADEDL